MLIKYEMHISTKIIVTFATERKSFLCILGNHTKNKG